jgi:hypothetical protein
MMHKFYDRLTLEKRVHLIINAVIQGDYGEVERLEQGFPPETLSWVERYAWAITRIILFMAIQLAPYKAQYEILANLQEQYAARQEANPQGGKVWQGLSDEMGKAKSIMISRAQTVWEGFNEFWKIKIISPDPPENFLRLIVSADLHLWLAETKEMFNKSQVIPEEVAETVQILNEIWVRYGGDLLKGKIGWNES